MSRPASDAHDSLANIRAVDCPIRLHIEDVFTSYREDDSDWFDAWRGQQSSPAIRGATLKAHVFGVGSARWPDCPLQSAVAHGLSLIPVSGVGVVVDGEKTGGKRGRRNQQQRHDQR